MPPNRFNFPTSEDITSVRARAMMGIQLTANKERTHVYKQWSEKATIVKYNSDTDTYNIIVSALNVSSSTQRTNRIIRDVKAIIPSTVHQFEPGDSVLIGYEKDRRESPVILGLRKGNTTQLNTGGGGGGFKTPSTTPPCDLRALNDAGEVLVDDAILTCDCNDFGATGTFGCCLRLECAVGEVQWAWSGQGKCTTADCFTSAIVGGTNKRKFCISKEICTHINPVTSLPFGTSLAATAKVRCFRFDSGGPSCMSGCNVKYRNCDGTAIPALDKVTFCAFGGNCTTDQPGGAPADCCVDPALANEAAHSTEVSVVSALIPACGSEPISPPVTADAQADTCGWFQFQEEGQNLELETSAAIIASMRANGCCPCTLADSTTISARDELGRTITITVRIQVTGEETILNPGDEGYLASCGS
jgi:hypothetical protein